MRRASPPSTRHREALGLGLRSARRCGVHDGHRLQRAPMRGEPGHRPDGGTTALRPVRGQHLLCRPTRHASPPPGNGAARAGPRNRRGFHRVREWSGGVADPGRGHQRHAVGGPPELRHQLRGMPRHSRGRRFGRGRADVTPSTSVAARAAHQELSTRATFPGHHRRLRHDASVPRRAQRAGSVVDCGLCPRAPVEPERPPHAGAPGARARLLTEAP